jgi:hypothetical protein
VTFTSRKFEKPQRGLSCHPDRARLLCSEVDVTQVKDSNGVEREGSDASASSRPRGGFRAHLQGVGLHDLVMLQNLVRASGAFVVLSGDRTGTMCFARGQLVHAEVLDLVGDAAALEILSWRDGEFVNADGTAPDRHTVNASLESLLLRLAKDVDEVRPLEQPITTATGVRRRMDGTEVFRTTHRGLGVPATPPGDGIQPPSHRGLAAAATPGTAAPVPRAALRASEPRPGVTSVLLSPLGTLLEGNGTDPETLGAKVGYMAKLAELVGQAMGAGESQAIKVRYAGVDLVSRRHADGHVSASQGPSDAVAEATPPSSSARHP